MNEHEATTMHKEEGKVTQKIEQRTAKIPSGTYLTLALGSIAASAALMLSGRRETANFVGQWVPTLLVIGVYNKLVKIERELFQQQGYRQQQTFR